MTKALIVKVQIPLGTNDPKGLQNAPCLVYTRGKRQTWMIPQTDIIRAACAATGRAFYEATVDGMDRLTLGREIEPQDF